MWPFKSKKPSKTHFTLKERVEAFWKWYAANAERFYEVIEDKRCSDLTDEVVKAVDQCFPGMAWVFGPGTNKIDHSFTLSGEGILAKQFVTDFWLKQAPRLDGWTFYSSRQPSNDAGRYSLRLEGSGEAFKPIEFWVCPFVNQQEEKIDITVWHPSIGRVAEKLRFTALFLILDELLGEFGTQRWIGEIKFSEDQLQRSMPIAELLEVIAEARDTHGWKQRFPIDTYSSYRKEEVTDDFPRGDIFVGTTRFFRLADSYFGNEGPFEHPLPNFGIDYAFVSIPSNFFPAGKQVDARGQIEDDIENALVPKLGGLCLGGASGHRNLYIDLALYDGDQSIQIVRDVLRKHQVPKETAIRFFTSDRGNEVTRVW